jgi:hypothetical protein
VSIPWHIKAGEIYEREKDYTATFSCTNGETGAVTHVAITQLRGGEALDLVGALRATAEVLRLVADGDELEVTRHN